MKREKPQEFLIQSKINSIFSNDKYLITAGDSIILWKCFEPRADVAKCQPDDVIIYDDEKIDNTQPSGALFNAIEVFDNTLSSDLQPRLEGAPSPILREDENIETEILDITPIDPDSIIEPEKCSSPLLPEVNLTQQEPVETFSIVKIMKNCKITEKPKAKEIKLPNSRLGTKTRTDLPLELYLPKPGEEACELIRTISFYGKSRNNCIWAQKRGELIYASGGFLIQETILNSRQKCISSDSGNCNIIVISLSSDDSRLAYSQLTSTSCRVEIINLEDSSSIPVFHQHSNPIHSIDWSKDNRWIVTARVGKFLAAYRENWPCGNFDFCFSKFYFLTKILIFVPNFIF